MEKGKKTIRIGIGLLAGYLVLLTVATFYSIRYYRDHLTQVTLTKPEPGKLTYILKQDAVVTEDGDFAEAEISYDTHVSAALLQPGMEVVLYDGGEARTEDGETGGIGASDADSGAVAGVASDVEDGAAGETGMSEIGRGAVAEYEKDDTNYLHLLKVKLPEKYPAGETVTLGFDSSALKEFQMVLPGRAVHLNFKNQLCVYTVEPEERSWGDEYIVKEETVLAFPPDPTAERVALLLPVEKPIVDWTSGYVYEGMSVWLRAAEPEAGE